MSGIVHIGDCRDLMRGMPEASIDAIVTDPPYGLAFMGKAWDHGVPGVEFWTEALRVARPGAYLLAFGGTRTYHRLTSAIEDAGWQIQDCLSWLYGSGFPKHKSKLKPSWEPIVLARKPAPSATPLNIDACRIGTAGRPKIVGRPGGPSVNVYADGLAGSFADGVTDLGRWPANVVLDKEASAALDAQSGTSTSPPVGSMGGGSASGRIFGKFGGVPHENGYGDEGGASRFFYTAKASRAERDAGLAHLPLQARPTMGSGIGGQPDQHRPNNRNVHPTVKPIALMRWLVRLVTPTDGVVLDPFCGSGPTLVAAAMEGRASVGCELSPEYAAIARARLAEWGQQTAMAL